MGRMDILCLVHGRGDGSTQEARPPTRTSTDTALPKQVTELIDTLSAIPGVVAVVLGGSRQLGCHDERSDWDIGLYYRDTVDLTVLAERGTVYPPGSWGRVMNGGAWLQCGGLSIDVLLRNLTAVEEWTDRAERGDFDVDALLGYLAGIPTYVVAAELSSCTVVHGELTAVSFPQRLAEAAPPRWRFSRSFSLKCARVHAQRGNVVGAVGHAARAAMEEAHAVLCERRQWVCNEKRLLSAAGLDGLSTLFGEVGSPDLVEWVNRVGTLCGTRQEGEWSGVEGIATWTGTRPTIVRPPHRSPVRRPPCHDIPDTAFGLGSRAAP